MNTDKKTVIFISECSGLTYQCAKNIASDKNFHILFACLSPNQSLEPIKKLMSETGNENIQAMEVDLNSLTSIRKFYSNLTQTNLPPIYSVICSTVIDLADSAKQTKDGFDLIFGVNHLGPFLLTNLLLNIMVDNSRIIFATSDQHNPPKLLIPKFEYINAKHYAYPYNNSMDGTGNRSSMYRYSISKLCNIYCAYEMAERIKSETDKKITVNAFSPGFMYDTEYSRRPKNILQLIGKCLAPIIAFFIGQLSSSEKSGEFLASLVTDSRFKTITGSYFDKTKISQSSKLSYNKENAKDLWDNSVVMVDLHQHETILKI